ncbi:MAG TPA: mechanosensitive ion channel domain-containing protein [Flavobacterium sp.]|jgi:small conductance mechanosensitive channel
MAFVLDIDSIGEYSARFFQVLVDYSPRLISALLILFVGLYAIRLINRFVRRLMRRKHMDPTLSVFLADILLWALRVLLFISFISKLGVESSSFVAILGAAGLAVGLSLQGSLSNFAGGMLIILFKPFRVGDYIEAQGVSGTVSEIQIFVTKLISSNNQTIFVPNGKLSNDNIVNFSLEENRKADISIAVSYDTNLQVAKTIIMEVLTTNPRVLPTPAPSVAVAQLTDHSVVIGVRPWAKNSEFWDMHAETLESIKLAFDNAGISIQPYVKEMSKFTEISEDEK